MRASQTKINQDVAVALERVIGRLENIEQWRREIDDERHEMERRLADRSEQRIQIDRATVAILLSALMSLIYLANLIGPHWKP